MGSLLKTLPIETDLTVVGFVIFFVLFLFFVGTTFLKSRTAIYRHLEQLPLNDQPEETRS